jgi:hypothetical protein
MFSHGCAGGDLGMLEQGHASPIGTPSKCVLDEGQIGSKPSISTSHKVGRRTMGTDAALVVGCDSR